MSVRGVKYRKRRLDRMCGWDGETEVPEEFDVKGSMENARYEDIIAEIGLTLKCI
jgi:hypothetical protein